jgi:hypothetical protein
LEVEAAKRVPSRRTILGAVKLLSKGAPATEEEDYDVIYSIHGDTVHLTFDIQ